MCITLNYIMIGYASETPIKTYTNVASMGATTIIMINTTYIIYIYTGRVNLDPPMTCADWPVGGNMTLFQTQTIGKLKP